MFFDAGAGQWISRQDAVAKLLVLSHFEEEVKALSQRFGNEMLVRILGVESLNDAANVVDRATR
jgi:DNA gyrase subunit B